MNLKILFQYGLMGLCLMGCSMNNAKAMDTDYNSDKILVVGCRPWDLNIQDIPGLERAHFADFYADGEIPVASRIFHHLDVNDGGPYSEASTSYQGPVAGKLSDFAASNPGRFETIVIDWATYHHFHREGAWADFSTLLSPGGNLIVPVSVSVMNIISKVSQSSEKAGELGNKIAHLFSETDIHQYETLPNRIEWNLLWRTDKIGFVTHFRPAFIFATK